VEATATHELKCDLAADVIRRFGVLRLRVSGFSMLPSIWPGDIACVSRVVAYRPGDVVLFSRKGRLFVHRVVEMSGGAVVTRGDSDAGRGSSRRAERCAGAGGVDRAGRVAGGDGRACERGAEGRRSGAGAVRAAGADGGPGAAELLP